MNTYRMFTLNTLTTYDTELDGLDQNILEMNAVDSTVNAKTQVLLGTGISIVGDIDQTYLDNLDASRNALETSLDTYDEKRNQLERLVGIQRVAAFKNKEAQLSSTYYLFVVWFFIMFILVSVLFIHIIEEQPQMNLFVKSLIHLVLLFVLYHILYNTYAYFFIGT